MLACMGVCIAHVVAVRMAQVLGRARGACLYGSVHCLACCQEGHTQLSEQPVSPHQSCAARSAAATQQRSALLLPISGSDQGLQSVIAFGREVWYPSGCCDRFTCGWVPDCLLLVGRDGSVLQLPELL